MGLISLLLSALFTISYASPYSKRPGRISYELKTNYFSSIENLDSSGDIVDIPAGNDFKEIKTNIRAEYDYSRFTTFYSDLTVNSVTTTTGTTERKETAMSDVVLGFEYLWLKSMFNVMPSFQVKIPLSTYSESTDKVLLNNNSIDAEALLHFSKRYSKIFLHAYGGFTYRTEGLSWLIPLGAEMIYVGRRFSFGGGIESFFSVTDDDYTSDKERRTDVTDRVSGGSLAYNAVNPSLTKVVAFAKFYVEPQLFIGAGIKQSIFGENSAYGTEFYGNLGFAFGGRTKRIPNLKGQKLENNSDEFELKFEEETDKDVDVFNKDQNIQYRESVDEKLDNVEEDIEIKLKKNRKNR
jgi:hypothetical protein